MLRTRNRPADPAHDQRAGANAFTQRSSHAAGSSTQRVRLSAGPRIARNVAPIHDARTACASSGVSRIPMQIYKRFHGARMQNDLAWTPASPTWQRRIRKRCTPRLRAYSSSRDQHDRTARTRLRTVRLLSNQTNRHIIRLPGRTPVIDSRPCRLRHTKPVASRRNQSRENLALPCRQLGLPARDQESHSPRPAHDVRRIRAGHSPA